MLITNVKFTVFIDAEFETVSMKYFQIIDEDAFIDGGQL